MSISKLSIPRGFTLIETIVVITLFTIMLFALFNFFINYNNTYLYEEAVVRTASSAGALVTDVTMYALPATQVLASRTFNGVTYTSGGGVLVLEVPAVNAAGAVVSATYDYVAFYSTGTKAYRIISANAASTRVSGTKQLSDSVSSLTFVYDNVSFPVVTKIEIDVVTALQVKGSTATQHLNQEVHLRNDSVI